MAPAIFFLALLTFAALPAQAATNCAFAFAQKSFSVPARNVVTFTVAVNTACTWTVNTTSSWITLSSAGPFTGTGSFAVSVADNSSATDRLGLIRINDQNIQIQQSGIQCVYSVTPPSPDVPAAGGAATFAVAADPACSWTVSSQAPWLTLPRTLTTGPGTFTAVATPNPTPQVRTGMLLIGAQQFSVSQAGTGITFSSSSIQNAASFANGPLSPGEIFVIYGNGLGPQTLRTVATSADGKSITTSLGNTRVLFDGLPAPLLYSSSAQVSGILPYAVAPGAAHVTVEYQGIASAPATVEIVPASPGIFTVTQAGFGQGAVRNQDFTLNGPDNAETAGRVLIVYWTGGGVLGPLPQDGKLIPANGPFPSVTLDMTATLGGITAPILYSGAVPTLAPGILQTNIRIPANAPKGDAVPLLFQIGDAYATQPGLTVAIR